MLIRLPLLGVPLDADEGGYAYLARQWADGGRLYGNVWVDRPQGLMLSYRLVTGLGHSKVWIHLAAIALAVLLAAAVAASGWALAGRRAALIAAFLVAVAGSAPHLQGFMFNGELAAGAFSAVAVAAALWSRRLDRGWLLVAAGVAGAVAVLMKQSGFDGLLVALCLSLAGQSRLRRLTQVCLGAGVPTGLAMLHAALTSWHDWWFAIVGYRLNTDAGTRGGLSGRWHNISADIPRLWPDLLPLGLLALAGLAYVLVKRSYFPLLWLVFASAGFFGGVFFFPHYWMQLVGPACLLGALALATVPSRTAIALTIVACLPAALWTVRATAASPDRRDRLAVPDGRLLANRDIAPWLKAHARAGDQLYAFVSSADLYYTTGLHTDFRYLWQANLEAIPAAVGQLRDFLASPDHPEWVVLYQRPDAIDPSGGIQAVLTRGYQTVTTIDGYPILRAAIRYGAGSSS